MRAYHRAALAASNWPWALGLARSDEGRVHGAEERRERAERCCSCGSRACRGACIGTPREEYSVAAGGYVEARGSNPRRQSEPDEAGLAFAAFALAHSGCEEEASELRLDERTLAGWCLRCDELKVFTIDRAGRGGELGSRPLPEGGPVS